MSESVLKHNLVLEYNLSKRDQNRWFSNDSILVPVFFYAIFICVTFFSIWASKLFTQCHERWLQIIIILYILPVLNWPRVNKCALKMSISIASYRPYYTIKCTYYALGNLKQRTKSHAVFIIWAQIIIGKSKLKITSGAFDNICIVTYFLIGYAFLPFCFEIYSHYYSHNWLFEIHPIVYIY